MINEAALQELVGFMATSPDNPVLSLYLNVDPRERTTETYKLAMRSLLDSTEGQINGDDRARVERFVELEYDWHGQGLVCFSCAADGFWHAHSLMVPVADRVFTGVRPYLKPLGDLLDTYARYGVVLVEREGAHIFFFNMGGLEGISGVAGEDVKRHKQGGWSAARYQRHEDEAAQRNLKDAVEMTADFVRSGRVRRLILGGTDDNVAAFSNLLPKHVHQAVVGTISSDLRAGPDAVGEKSLALIREVSAIQKAREVERLITTAAKGGPAALGLANTLAAAFTGRAHHLILDDAFAAPAYRCDNCGFVGTEALTSCPLCEHDIRVLPDAADSLVRWAIGHDIELTVVPNSQALQDAGSIGVFLRY